MMQLLPLAITLFPTLVQSALDVTYEQIGVEVKFHVNTSDFAGTPPLTYQWSFGDGETSEAQHPIITYSEKEAVYDVECTVTSATDDVTESESTSVEVAYYKYVTKDADSVRVAQFNTGLSDQAGRVEGELQKQLKDPSWVAAQKIADVIQKNRPDILSLQEFDHVWIDNDTWDGDATKQMVQDFQDNFLADPQAHGNEAIKYPYVYVAPCNTGVQTGFDLDKNGNIGDAGDAHGYGDFPGSFSMVLLSMYPIDTQNIRTFQHFLWKDMQEAYLPLDPATGDMYYTEDELNVLRLSSKSHLDIPVKVGEDVIHILQSHPTPPVFDDGTAAEYPPKEDIVDWNGWKNNNEIRFWTDYIDEEKSTYIYDDNEWMAAGNTTPPDPSGGLKDKRFIIIGDQNCDPVDGDASPSAASPINDLLDSDSTDTSMTPTSKGGLEQANDQYQNNRESKTAPWGLRADYVLPSTNGLEMTAAYVHWPERKDVEAYLNDASDHMMVVVDAEVVPVSSTMTMLMSQSLMFKVVASVTLSFCLLFL